MKRFWVSWWSGYYADEGCTKPPFQVWVSGERMRRDEERSDYSICAVIDAESERLVWGAVKYHFPDFEKRFCEEKPSDFKPGDRFPDFEDKTTLVN